MSLKEKGKTFKLTTLKERREKINGMLLRRCSTIEDLLFSTKNLVAMEGELAELNYLVKMLMDTHEEHNVLLDDEARATDNDWFDNLDNQVCTFTRKRLLAEIVHEEQQSL